MGSPNFNAADREVLAAGEKQYIDRLRSARRAARKKNGNRFLGRVQRWSGFGYHPVPGPSTPHLFTVDPGSQRDGDCILDMEDDNEDEAAGEFSIESIANSQAKRRTRRCVSA